MLVAMLSFTACNDNDEESNSSYTENNTPLDIGMSLLYFNNDKINTTSNENYTINNRISYHRDENIYNLYITIEDIDGNETYFRFDNINLNELKVGDDIVKLAEWYHYQIENYEGHMYGYYSYMTDKEEPFGGHQGQFIVKEIEKINDEFTLRINFDNVKVFFAGVSAQSSVDIKGAIKAKVNQ